MTANEYRAINLAGLLNKQNGTTITLDDAVAILNALRETEKAAYKRAADLVLHGDIDEVPLRVEVPEGDEEARVRAQCHAAILELAEENER